MESLQENSHSKQEKVMIVKLQIILNIEENIVSMIEIIMDKLHWIEQ